MSQLEKYLKAWINPEVQGVTHNSKIGHTASKAVIPRCLPSEIPIIPELCSGDLEDPELQDLDICKGAVQGGQYFLLHYPTPMCPHGDPDAELAKNNPTKEENFRRLVNEGVFPPLTPGRGSLFERFCARDEEVLAFAPEPAEAYAAQVEAAGKNPQLDPAVDHWMKQVYFPVDGGYHLLGIAPSSLMYVKFWEACRREGVRYPQHVKVQLGGLEPRPKPQNVGTCAQKHRGEVFLLSSLPPMREKPKTPYRNLFDSWLYSPYVKEMFATLQNLLLVTSNNRSGRDRRDGMVRAIAENLISYRNDIWALPGGWSKSTLLPEYQKAWLDPESNLEVPIEDIYNKLSRDFGRQVDHQLKEIAHGREDREQWVKILLDILEFEVEL